MWLCYLPIYLEIKNKREKNIEKNYNHIDKNHIIWDFDLPFSSTELCCASFKYQTRKRLENIKLSFENKVYYELQGVVEIFTQTHDQ